MYIKISVSFGYIMTILAIDLGTTNSLCAVYTSDGPKLIPNSLGEYLTPSVVAVSDKSEFIVGRAALDFGVVGKYPYLKSIKRYMGSKRTIQIGKQLFSPEEISAIILQSLKKDAEVYLDEVVKDAIISVPAYFNNKQRQATKIAGQLAGLNVIRLINEPTAAALAYGIANKDINTKYLIFDLGGGTFDVTIMELFEDILEVRSSAGDNFLGGDDFTDAIVNSFLKKCNLIEHKLDIASYTKLWQQAEYYKTSALKDGFNITVDINDKTYTCTFTTLDIQNIFSPLLNRLTMPIKRALNDSRLNSEDIESVILVGGATKMHMIPKICAQIFKKLSFIHLNPQEIVAMGAACLAGMLANSQDLEERVLSDVCPYTLGTSANNIDHKGNSYTSYVPIIERNSVIPISRSKIFYITTEFQKQVSIDVYQGESRLIENNIKIAEYILDVPNPSKEPQELEIRYTYDVNGILEVQVKFEKSNNLFTQIIKESCGNMSDNDIAASIAKLNSIKLHPREMSEHIALLARAERLYEESLGEQRENIAEKIQLFYTYLDTQDLQIVNEMKGKFAKFLDQCEYEHE